MADDESTAISTNDEALDTEDVELEDIEVSLEDITDDDTEEKDSESEEKEDTEPTESEESEEDKEPEEESQDEPEESVQSDEDKKKAFNREMAERRIQEKQQRERIIKESQQEYLQDSEDDKDLALRELQVQAYNTKVEGNTNKLTNAYEKAIKDFDILSSDDPAIAAAVDEAIDTFQAKYVTIDQFGNAGEVNADLYLYLQSKADSISHLVGIRESNKAASKAREKSKVFTPPSKAPQPAKTDPDLDAFDEEANK